MVPLTVQLPVHFEPSVRVSLYSLASCLGATCHSTEENRPDPYLKQLQFSDKGELIFH